MGHVCTGIGWGVLFFYAPKVNNVMSERWRAHSGAAEKWACGVNQLKAHARRKTKWYVLRWRRPTIRLPSEILFPSSPRCTLLPTCRIKDPTHTQHQIRTIWYEQVSSFDAWSNMLASSSGQKCRNVRFRLVYLLIGLWLFFLVKTSPWRTSGQRNAVGNARNANECAPRARTATFSGSQSQCALLKSRMNFKDNFYIRRLCLVKQWAWPPHSTRNGEESLTANLKMPIRYNVET